MVSWSRFRIEELEEELDKIDYDGPPPEDDLKGMDLCWRHMQVWVAGNGLGNIIMVVIILNVMMMASEHHGQPDKMTFYYKWLNIVFTAIFAFELVLKHVVLGPVQYWSDSFNCFDGLIVVVSVIEVFQILTPALHLHRSLTLTLTLEA